MAIAVQGDLDKMKENSVLHVLMYLFQNHMQNNCQIDESEVLIDQLESAGFVLPVINQAIDWLANLADSNTIAAITTPQTSSFRFYTPYEITLFGEQCINFITHLEKENILTPITRELVIHQAIELQAEGIDLNLIKWVTLMVLFNQPEHDEALSCMELLVLENPPGGIH